MQKLVPVWKLAGSRIGRLHSFAEVPLYVDSKASRVIQATDFVAWSVWHYYEHGHTEHITKLNRRFDADLGTQHGLAHLIRGYAKCPCVPCSSRRDHVVSSTIPVLPSPVSP